MPTRRRGGVESLHLPDTSIPFQRQEKVTKHLLPDTSIPSQPRQEKAIKQLPNAKRSSLLRTVKKDFRTCCCLSLLFGAAIFSTAALLLRVPALPVDPAAITAAGNRYVKLKDGRLLEYVVCGAPEPTLESVEAPMAVYAAHAYASTGGNLAAPWMCEAYQKFGMRVFAVTMPGFGLSDSMPLGQRRSLAEWGADVLAVLEQEGVIEENLSEETSSSEETPRHQSSYRKKIGILGLSTGCVHATAVARALPPDRIQGILLSSPTAPIAAERAHSGIAGPTLVTKKLLGTPYVGDVLAWVMGKVPFHIRIASAPDVAAAYRKMLSTAEEVGTAVARDSDRGTVHTYRGLADNMHTIVDDVPFDLKTGVADPVIGAGARIGITTSPDDTTNPPAMQRWFHSQLPGSELVHFEPGWGHLHLLNVKNFDRALAFLAAENDVSGGV